MPKLAEQEVRDRIKTLKSWTIENGELHKTYSFKDFRGSMAFATRVALIAESMDHHPDIDIRYSKVTLNLMTHSAGGLTESDFKLAGEIDAV